MYLLDTNSIHASTLSRLKRMLKKDVKVTKQHVLNESLIFGFLNFTFSVTLCFTIL